MEEAAEQAKSDEEPDGDALFEDVYAKGSGVDSLRGCEPTIIHNYKN